MLEVMLKLKTVARKCDGGDDALPPGSDQTNQQSKAVEARIE
jgi:hypothetical protein